MAKYHVHFQTSASLTVTVEADSSEEAEELAYEEIPSLCWQCGDIDLGDFEVEPDQEFRGVKYPGIELVED
jgi:hypothetical protein